MISSVHGEDIGTESGNFGENHPYRHWDAPPYQIRLGHERHAFLSLHCIYCHECGKATGGGAYKKRVFPRGSGFDSVSFLFCKIKYNIPAIKPNPPPK